MFYKQIGIISLKEWRLHFKAWMWAKRQWNPIFNPWWAFELLPQHFFQILELKYEGICWDKMKKIQDFQKKKRMTLITLCT
jgi:hypothetical protein